MHDPNSKIITPGQNTPLQDLQMKVDQLAGAMSRLWDQILPTMEQNFMQALTTAFYHNNALMIALRDKGVITEEDMSVAMEKAKAEMEKKHAEAVALQQAAQATSQKEAEIAKGPKIVSPTDLETLEDGQPETVQPEPQTDVPPRNEEKDE